MNSFRNKQLKAGLFRRRKHKPLFIEIHRTTRGILVQGLGDIRAWVLRGRPLLTFSESSRKG